MAAKRKSADAPASASIWAVIGSDDLKVKEVAQALSRKLIPPEAGDFGLEVVEGAADNSEGIIRVVGNTLEALQTLPMFGGEKLVWLQATNIFAQKVGGRDPSESALAAIGKLSDFLQSQMPPDVKLLLTATEIDKRRSFFLTLKKIANIEVYDTVDTSKSGWEEAVVPVVEERADEYGLRFSPDSLHLFVMLAGEQSRQIDNELEKLDLFLGERRSVEVADVRAIVSKTHTGVVWELGSAIGSRDLQGALAMVDELMHKGEKGVGILLSAVVPKMRAMYQAREISERHGIRVNHASRYAYQDYVRALEKLPPDIVAALPKKKEGGINGYPLFLAARDADNFTAAELREALEHCLAANRRLVTTGLDPRIVLNQMLMRILSRPPAPQKSARQPGGRNG